MLLNRMQCHDITKYLSHALTPGLVKVLGGAMTLPVTQRHVTSADRRRGQLIRARLYPAGHDAKPNQLFATW